MPVEERPVLIYATFPSQTEARRIGRALVEGRLAACVNIFSPMTAIFEWEGKLEEASEAAMFIKTRADLEADVIDMVKREHPHDTPALLVLDVSGGSSEFLQWIIDQTKPGEPIETD